MSVQLRFNCVCFHLNNKVDSSKFTVEDELTGSFLFLDLLVPQKFDGFGFAVYGNAHIRVSLCSGFPGIKIEPGGQ